MQYDFTLVKPAYSGLFNIRGADIPYNPVVFSIVVLTESNVHLFIDTRKLSAESRRHLGLVVIHEYSDAIDWIKEWYKKESTENQQLKVCFYSCLKFYLPQLKSFFVFNAFTNYYSCQIKIYVPNSTNFEIGSIFEQQHCVYGPSMIQVMKAVKNDTELRGMRSSHVSISNEFKSHY